MKAIFCTQYGPPEVLQLREAEKPIPRQDEVLIKVFATAVTASDIFIRSSEISPWLRIQMRLMLGILRPRNPIIGVVLAGKIAAAGKGVQRFQPGDRVYGITGLGLGAYAEYKCMPVTDSPFHGCLAQMPSHLTYEEATAAVYGGLLALQALERGKIQPGHRVLIYGASGTTGTMAIQLAKQMGAEVTGVCGTPHLELVRSLGADSVIDYRQEDATPAQVRYDFILDAVGKAKSSRLKESLQQVLNPQGRYVSIDDGKLELKSDRLLRLNHLLETGALRPVLDRCYPLEQISAAHAYVAKGHKQGGVAITVAQEE